MRYPKALLVVDMQNDFLPGGGLSVPEGDLVIRPLNKYLKAFAAKGLPVFLSRDWHPEKTAHFKKWPVHCVQGTRGARFCPGLDLPRRRILLYKGMDPKEDSYSVFQAKDQDGIPFPHLLKILGTRELYIGGLATDYCVKSTALDALKEGISVYVLKDAIKGVDLKKGDSAKAIALLREKGARFITVKGLHL